MDNHLSGSKAAGPGPNGSPKKLSPMEARQQLAEAGDVAGLLDAVLGQVAHLLAAQASTARQWALARRPAKDAGGGRARGARAGGRSAEDWDFSGRAMN